MARPRQRADASRVRAALLDARLLGLGCALACDLILLNGFRPAQLPQAPDTLGVFHVLELLFFCLGALAACAVLAAGGVIARRAARRPGWAVPLAASIALFAAGMAALALRGSPGGEPSWYAAVCGVPLGAASSLLLVLWGGVYSALAPRRGFVWGAASYALGIALSMLAPLAFGGVGQEAIWVASQLLGCASLAWVLLAPPSGAGTEEDHGHSVRPPQSPQFRKAARYLGIAWAGYVLFAFLLGVFWRKYSNAVFHDPGLETAAAWLCAAGLSAALAGLSRRGGFDALYRIAVPMAALLLLADPFLSLMGVGEMFVVSGVFWTFCLVTFGSVSWTATAAAHQRCGLLPRSAFAAYRAAWAAALGLGVVVGEVAVPQDLKLFFSAAIVAFLAAVVAIQVLGSRPTAPDADKEDASDEMPDYGTRAREMACRHGLSDRETAVFRYLMQGRGEAFIAQKLSISPNTVKAHRRNIYRKLGVSSREELLDLVQRELEP